MPLSTKKEFWYILRQQSPLLALGAAAREVLLSYLHISKSTTDVGKFVSGVAPARATTYQLLPKK